MTSGAVLLMFALTAVWAALVVLAPLMVPAGTLTDLSGRVGFHDNDLLLDELSPLPHAIYWIGDAECHQLANRSFFLNDNQMPFCARDVGLFVGLALASGVVTFIRYKVNPLLVLAGLVPIGLDGGIQLVTEYESNNLLRVATGLLAGAALALLMAHFVFALQEDRPRDRTEGKDPPCQ
ncbi:MAG: DUF2085 domain-containing protein [Candidatus Thermoplasmatota archaeon]